MGPRFCDVAASQYIGHIQLFLGVLRPGFEGLLVTASLHWGLVTRISLGGGTVQCHCGGVPDLILLRSLMPVKLLDS